MGGNSNDPYLYSLQIPAECLAHVPSEQAALLRGEGVLPKGAGLYPEDISAEELESLPRNLRQVPFTYVRKQGELHAIPNHQRFRAAIARIERAARHVSGNVLFAAQMRAVRSDKYADRKQADIAYARSNETMQLLLSSANEVYLDPNNTVGQAEGTVHVRDPRYGKVQEDLTRLLDRLYAASPMDYKPGRMPIELDFRSVYAWSGAWFNFPFATMAQNLPNDEHVKRKIGTKSIAFTNIDDALTSADSYRELSARLLQPHVASVVMQQRANRPLLHLLHEVGHSFTEHRTKKAPRHIFGDDYNVLDEALQETFSLWAMSQLREWGVVSEAVEVAAYGDMLLACVRANASPPTSYAGARNFLFHSLAAKGGFSESQGRFGIDIVKAREAAKDTIMQLSRVRAAGDLAGWSELKGQYVRTEDRERFAKLCSGVSLGVGIIFPSYNAKTGEFTHPAKFYEQPPALDRLLR